jgi:hypothetical protein
MKLKKIAKLSILTLAVPTLLPSIVLSSLKSAPVLAASNDSNLDAINIYSLLNNQTLSEQFTTPPTISTLVRSIKTQFTSIAPYVNQLDFTNQSASYIYVSAVN